MKQYIEQVHRGVKDYQCDEYTYACFLKSSLEIHRKQLHTKLRDFECDKCRYSCSLEPQLDQHINQVHQKQKTLNVTNVGMHVL